MIDELETQLQTLEAERFKFDDDGHEPVACLVCFQPGEYCTCFKPTLYPISLVILTLREKLRKLGYFE